MTNPDDDFDQHLRGLFQAAEPLPDDRFTARVIDALPAPSPVRPVLLAASGLAGVAIAGTQLPELAGALDVMLGGFGVMTVDAIGVQALAMGFVAAALVSAMAVLFRQSSLDV